MRNEKEKKNPTFLGPWEKQRLQSLSCLGPSLRGLPPHTPGDGDEE